MQLILSSDQSTVSKFLNICNFRPTYHQIMSNEAASQPQQSRTVLSNDK